MQGVSWKLSGPRYVRLGFLCVVLIITYFTPLPGPWFLVGHTGCWWSSAALIMVVLCKLVVRGMNHEKLWVDTQLYACLCVCVHLFVHFFACVKLWNVWDSRANTSTQFHHVDNVLFFFFLGCGFFGILEVFAFLAYFLKAVNCICHSSLDSAAS